MTIDHDDLFRLELLRRLDDMREHRLAGDRMQDLGEPGFHPSALPGCKDDDAEFHLVDVLD